MDLATPPASFTITGNGFANLGFGLPMVNFMRGTTLLAQARATALTGTTTLTVPFPTPATSITPNLPGLSAGPVQAQVWQQTGSAPTFSLIGSAALTVTDTRVCGVTARPRSRCAPPASATLPDYGGSATPSFGPSTVHLVRRPTRPPQ